MDLSKFIKSNLAKKSPQKIFNTAQHITCVNMEQDEEFFIKIDSMIAYEGDVKFIRKSTAGIGKKILVGLSGENLSMVRATAKTKAVLYLASSGQKTINLKLEENQSIAFDGRDCLLHSKGIKWTVTKDSSVGKFLATKDHSHIKFTGPGFVSVLAFGDPLIIPVVHNKPISVDPSNIVAWSTNLKTQLKTDRSIKSVVLRKKTGEEVQLKYSLKQDSKKSGFVIIQSACEQN